MEFLCGLTIGDQHSTGRAVKEALLSANVVVPSGDEIGSLLETEPPLEARWIGRRVHLAFVSLIVPPRTSSSLQTSARALGVRLVPSLLAIHLASTLFHSRLYDMSLYVGVWRPEILTGRSRVVAFGDGIDGRWVDLVSLNEVATQIGSGRRHGWMFCSIEQRRTYSVQPPTNRRSDIREMVG